MLADGGVSVGDMVLNKSKRGAPLLSDWLREAGLWDPKLSADEARVMVSELEKYKMQTLAAEEAAAKHRCLVLYLPNASPALNIIERLWRMIKEKWARVVPKERTMSTLARHWRESFDNSQLTASLPGGAVSRVRSWQDLSLRYGRWMMQNPTSAELPTEEQVATDASLSQLVDTEFLADLTSSNTTFDQLRKVFHMVNWYRRSPSTDGHWFGTLARKYKL